MFSATTTLILFICLQTPTSGIICAEFFYLNCVAGFVLYLPLSSIYWQRGAPMTCLDVMALVKTSSMGHMHVNVMKSMCWRRTAKHVKVSYRS